MLGRLNLVAATKFSRIANSSSVVRDEMFTSARSHPCPYYGRQYSRSTGVSQVMPVMLLQHLLDITLVSEQGNAG